MLNIISHPSNVKIVENISWLFFDKTLKTLAGMYVLIHLARYLEPSEFGILNYHMAIISIFIALCSLGLNGIVVRDLVSSTRDENQILGTSAVLIFIASIICYALAAASVTILRTDDKHYLFIWILGVSILTQSSQIVRFWFEAKTASKYVIWTENCVFMAFCIIKLLAIYLELTLIHFACILSLEFVTSALALSILYRITPHQKPKWSVSLKEAKLLLNEAWPLIISSVAYVAYLKMDQIMIGVMLGNDAVGVYSAAAQLTEKLNLISMMIVSSVMPSILIHKNNNRATYLKYFQHTYDVTIGIMLVIAFFVSLWSKEIVSFLYGERYAETASALTILVWSGIAFSMAITSGRYLIYESQQKITMLRHVFGLAANIPLNLFLIPSYNTNGAAMATVISLFLSCYVLDLIRKETREIFAQKTRAVFMIWIFNLISNKRK